MVKDKKNGKILGLYLSEIFMKVYAMDMVSGSMRVKNTTGIGPTI